jgi:hypothetical protein
MKTRVKRNRCTVLCDFWPHQRPHGRRFYLSSPYLFFSSMSDPQVAPSKPPARLERSPSEEALVQDNTGVTYLYRWVVLGLFCITSLSNAANWITFSTIFSYAQKWYEVPSLAIDFLSLVYMIVYIPCIFVSSWFLARFGLRKGVRIYSKNFLFLPPLCKLGKKNQFAKLTFERHQKYNFIQLLFERHTPWRFLSPAIASFSRPLNLAFRFPSCHPHPCENGCCKGITILILRILM